MNPQSPSATPTAAALATLWGAIKGARERLIAVSVGSVLLTAALMNLEFNLLEGNLFDLRMTRGLQLAPDPRITLLTLDDATLQSQDDFPPLPLSTHARLLEALELLEPRGVGYLIDLNQVQEVSPEIAAMSEWRERFTSSVRRLELRGTPVLLGTPFDVTGEVMPPFPLSALPHAVSTIHSDGNVFAEDKVARRASLSLYGKPTFHAELARRILELPQPPVPPGVYEVPEIDARFFFFRYHGNTTIQNANGYARLSMADVLAGKLPPGALRGKILLISTLLREDSNDYVLTPYSKSPFVNPQAVVHANILDSILHGHGIARPPQWVNAAVTLVMSASVLWWVMTSTPLYGVFATLSLALGFIVIGQLLFQLRGLWIRESQPLMGILVGYYLVVPYRLIREYKKRWDYQRKTELMTQVEELKTNFLSLVTHDLKTPVARIQGLAEVLLRQAGARLLTQDQQALQHILASTSELNHFITSILELNRVESNRLHLQLESKDINQLIERSAESFRSHAEVREIRLQLKLEPLFPIKLDAALLSKVINNLIDNALKYSPTGSQIEVASREDGDWVVIEVRDQGIGLSPAEIEHLFTRFYRAKNDTTTRVSGTGLGLYLTRYFVEAHGGFVEVESVPQQGSTFRIRLPLVAKPVAGLARNPHSVPNLTQDFKGEAHV